MPIIEDIEIDKYQLLKSFKEINTFANIKLMKCINGVLKLKELKNNYGFFIFFVIIVNNEFNTFLIFQIY